jgi:hypothetical protein
MLARLARSLRNRKQQTNQAARAAAAASNRVAAPTLEKLENRQMLAVSPVVAGTKIKGFNQSVNNISTNSTVIIIPFTGDINLVDATKIRLFGYAINPLSANLGQVKKTVNVTNAQVLALDANGDGTVDHSLLQLTTDRLMRKGGTIILNEGALTDKNGDTLATQTLKTIKGQNKERFTLANRLFTMTDHTRFTNDIFADANPANASTAPADATVTANLTTFLGQKVTAGIITQAQADAALTRYNSDAAKGTIPDANLRAALFSLTGTFAESAISSYLDGTNITGKPYTIITFQTPTDTTVPVAQTSVRASDGRLRTIFWPKFAGESFIALSAHLAHEALHQDTSTGLQEEETANIFETLIYAQQIQAQILAGTKPVSTVMSQNTALVNLENDKLGSFIQSGRTIFPYPGVLDAPHTINLSSGVFPGQKTPGDSQGVYTGFDNFIQRIYKERGSVSQNTPGLPILKTYYDAVTGGNLAANAQFSNTIINGIDSFQNVIGTHLAIQIAQGLRMGLA